MRAKTTRSSTSPALRPFKRMIPINYIARADHLIQSGYAPMDVAREMRRHIIELRISGDTLQTAHDVLAVLESRARGDQTARVRALLESP